eukprot:9119266-Pyramimonas_sp.AAC.1
MCIRDSARASRAESGSFSKCGYRFSAAHIRLHICIDVAAMVCWKDSGFRGCYSYAGYLCLSPRKGVWARFR